MTKEICLNRPLNGTDQGEAAETEFSAFNSECDALLEDSGPDSRWKTHKSFTTCKEMNSTERKLQIKSGFGSHIKLPMSSSSLRGPQELQTGNVYKYNTKKICVSVLSLHYVKTCEKLCDAGTASMVKEGIFPRSCLPICTDFASHVCIRGCSLFGCNVSSELCNYQMCNFQLA